MTAPKFTFTNLSRQQIEHAWSLVPTHYPVDTCWPWQGNYNSHGYGRIGFGKRYFVAHRMVYWMAYGIDPQSLYVCHKCDNPSCVNPDHLFIGTATDNYRDMVNKGRHANGDNMTPEIKAKWRARLKDALLNSPRLIHGSRSPAAKLTEDNVREIRRRCAAGETQISLAREFGVSDGNINNIVARRAWTRVI